MYRSSGISGARPMLRSLCQLMTEQRHMFVFSFACFPARPAHVLKLCLGHQASGVSALSCRGHGSSFAMLCLLFVAIDRVYHSLVAVTWGVSDGGNRTAGLEDTQDAVACERTQKKRQPSPMTSDTVLPQLLCRAGTQNTRQRQHTGDDLDLGDSVGITQDDTNLGRGGALLGQLADLVDDLVGGGLEPRGGAAAVGDSRG